MKKCIYCLKEEGEVTFHGEEHVISKCLGGTPFPVLSVVCDSCNSNVISGLEDVFKKDSLEGIYAQMYRIGDTHSVWIRGLDTNISTVSGFGDKFFDEIFPFLKIENGQFVVDCVPQLKIRNASEGFQVFPLEYMYHLAKSKGRKFEKLKERLVKTPLKDMALYTGTKDGDSKEMNEAIALLKEYGIDYKEKERKFVSNDNIQNQQFEFALECQIGDIQKRVIAKIAFNYYVYCCIKNQPSELDKVYGNEFNEIRNYIREGVLTSGAVVTPNDGNGVLSVEGNIRAVAHTIAFERKDDYIFAKITLFGSIVYKVIIGKSPYRMVNPYFGCGHVFDPFTAQIYQISNHQYALQRRIEDSFGLSMFT